MALFIGASGDNGAHRHHALQLTVGLDRAATVETPAQSAIRGAALLIAADAEHALKPGRTALAYFEPESNFGRLLAPLIGKRHIRTLPAPAAEKLRRRLSSASAWTDPAALGRGLISDLTAPAAAAATGGSVDRRVARALRAIDERLNDAPDLSELAGLAAASPSHLRALFRRDVGLSIKRYRLWARLRRALTLLASGRALTDAAVAAGFADAAHLTRTFRAMFGTTPTSALQDLQLAAIGEKGRHNWAR